MFVFLTVIIIAFIVDLIIGDPYGFPHPVIYIGKLISKLEKFFRSSKAFNSDKGKMKVAGLIIWLVVVFVTGVITFIITSVFDHLILLKIGVVDGRELRAPIMDIIVSIIVMWTCFSTKCLAFEAKKIYIALKKDGEKEEVLSGARKQLSYIVGRETQSLSEKEIIRATVETVAENTVDGTISPLFYAFIGGPVLAMIYKAINTMDSMLGYKNEKYIDIGMFPARLDDVFNYIPARLSLLFFCIASMFLGYDFNNSFKIGFRDRKNHKSPNCAFSEGAVAGALGIQLGGTNTYFGEVVYKPTIGDKNREIEVEDIDRSIKLMYVSAFVSLVLFTVTYIVLRMKF